MAKMKIFVSWSGARSAAVAQALKEYLPMINNAFDPWLSSKDIRKGSRSTAEIAEALVAAKAGIICLTNSNLTAPWILYEAGAIAKTVDKPLACTLLIGLEPSDVAKPLGEFQHTRLLQNELLQLMQDLNSAAGENSRQPGEVEKAFNLCWPELKERLENLPSEETKRPERSQGDILAEILDTVRSGNLEAEKRGAILHHSILIVRKENAMLRDRIASAQLRSNQELLRDIDRITLDDLFAEDGGSKTKAQILQNLKASLAKAEEKRKK